MHPALVLDGHSHAAKTTPTRADPPGSLAAPAAPPGTHFTRAPGLDPLLGDEPAVARAGDPAAGALCVRPLGGPAPGHFPGHSQQPAAHRGPDVAVRLGSRRRPVHEPEVARAAVALGRGPRDEDRRHQPARNPADCPLYARTGGSGGAAELGPSLGTIVDPGPSSSTKGAKVASYRLHAEDITAPFAGRGGASKAKLLRREGGRSIPRRRSRTGSTGSSATSAPTAPGA